MVEDTFHNRNNLSPILIIHHNNTSHPLTGAGGRWYPIDTKILPSVASDASPVARNMHVWAYMLSLCYSLSMSTISHVHDGFFFWGGDLSPIGGLNRKQCKLHNPMHVLVDSGFW